ncbi:MAG: hypothetical protein K2Y39_10665 [Candidatus Obscuribacterales bacterium]|nr:hypothetical protein [Candidatus Obscuribacterales bacterium]
MQKARFLVAAAVFSTIAFLLPFVANLLPDHTRTLAKAPEIISRAYIDRVVDFVVSGRRADMVVAGSSLVIFPHVLTDGYYEKVPVPVPDPIEYADFLTRYVDMAHFRSILMNFGFRVSASNRQVRSVIDLGVPSLMLSDCVLLFQKLEDNGALPDEVVLLLAPRDFMDNTVAVERNLFSHEINGRVTFRALSRAGDAGEFLSGISAAAGYWANAWCKQFRNSFERVSLAVKKLGRQPNREVLQGGKIRKQALQHFYFGNGKFSDLEIYEKRYNPPDHKRIKKELAAMGTLLDQLQSRNVHTVVVSMPLTEMNIALIDRDAHREILDGMRSACQSRSIRFLSAEQLGNYPSAAFVDSVHLNAKGGHEFFISLARLLTLQASRDPLPVRAR